MTPVRLFCLIAATLSLQGCWLSPATPLGPSTTTPVTTCGWREIAGFQASTATPDTYLLIRSAAEWDAYKAGTGSCWTDPATHPNPAMLPAAYPTTPPPVSTALDGFDFSQETILVFNFCGPYYGGFKVLQACADSNRITVDAEGTWGDAVNLYVTDYSKAFALPATGLPVRLNLCVTTYGSQSCSSIDLP